MTTVKIEHDSSTDMACISVGEVCVFEGNTWDFTLEVVEDILKKIPNVTVENSNYSYGD